MPIITPESLLNPLYDIKTKNKIRKGLSTGWETIDAHMLLNKQYLFVLTGYPNMGKSAWLDALAVNSSLLHGWNWLYFSPEMDAHHTHLQKLVQKKSGKRLVHLTNEEIRAEVAWAQSHYAWIDPGEAFYSLDDVMATTEQRILEGHQVDVMVIDPWNELCHRAQEGKRDDIYISQQLLKLKKFNRRYDILSVVVIHPHSVTKDKDGNFPIPALRDCAGGAMWWNKADYGVCVHRVNPTKHGADILIQKIKEEEIGSHGRVFLDYEPGTGRFKDTTAEYFSVPDRMPF